MTTYLGLLLVVSVVGMATGAVQDPQASGRCYCVSHTGVNVRSSACGTVLGSTTTGQSYKSRGGRASSCGYQWFSLDFGGREAWIAGDYLNACADSNCGSGPALNDKFYQCVCNIESNCNRNIGCLPDPVTLSCGPYQIKDAYWRDASQHAGKNIGGDWKTCTTGSNNLACSREVMANYFARYGKYCTGGREPTAEDYARIHNGGPLGCKSTSTAGYWAKVRGCLGV